MNADTLLESFEILAEAPYGISRLRSLIVELAIRGRFSNLEKIDGNGFPSSWDYRPASDFFKSRSGNSKLIKGKLFNEFAEGRYPGYSASGQDVWLDSAEHSGEAAILSAVGARCGKAFRASGSWSAIANTHIIWLNDKRVVPDYGMLILDNEKFWIRSGSAQPFVKVKASLEQKIGIPPLVEQRRIVAKVDELMALCDQLEQQQKQRDNLRTATRRSAIDAISTAITPEELETAWKRINNNWDVIAGALEDVDSMRAMILNLAVHGKFSNLSGSLTNGEADFIDLGSLMTLEYGKPLDKTLRNLKGHIPVYGANGVKAMTGQPLVKERGIVVGRKGSAGEVNITDGPFWPLDVTFFAKFDQNAFDIYYLFYLLKALDLPRLARGIKPGINRNDVNKLKVLSVNLEEQKLIVSKVDELMALCDQLEESLTLRGQMAEKFTRSVTHAA